MTFISAPTFPIPKDDGDKEKKNSKKEKKEKDLGLPTFSALEKAQKEFTDEEIIETISEKSPKFSSRIKQAKEAGHTDSEILDSFKESRKRTVPLDLGVSLVTGLGTGLAASPFAAARGVRGLIDLATDPKNTVRQLLGFEPIPEEKSIAEQMLGPENYKKAKDTLGISAAEDFFGSLTDPNLGKELFDFEKREFLFDKLEKGPTREDIRSSLEKTTGLDLTPQTSPGRIVESFTGRFGEALPFGPQAAFSFGMGGAAGQSIREAGGPEGLANVADIGLSFTKFKRPEKVKFKVPVQKKQIANAQRDLTQKRVANLKNIVKPIEGEGSLPENLSVKDRIKKVDISFDPLSDTQLIDEVQQAHIPNMLTSIDPIRRTRREALGVVREGIDEQFTRHRAHTSNLYNEVNERVGQATSRMDETLDRVVEFLGDLDESGLPRATRTNVENFIRDQIFSLFEDDGSITIENAIKLKQSLNNFVDFEFPDLTAKRKFKNIINPIVKESRRELNRSIRELDRDAFINFRRAERSHAQDVERFGKDIIIKIQRGEDPLKIIKNITDPSEFKALKEGLRIKNSRDLFSHQYSTLERLLVEELNLQKTSPTSKRVMQDIKPELSINARNAVDFIEDVNNPFSNAGKRNQLKLAVLNSITEAAETGQLPVTAIKMGQTPKGLDLVRETLRKTSEGRSALKSVESGIINSIYDKFLSEDGLINIKNLKKILDNQELENVIRKIQGPQGISNLKNIENISKSADAKLQSIFKDQAFKKKRLKPGDLEPLKPLNAPTEFQKFIQNPAKWIKENKSNAFYGVALLKTLGITMPQIVGLSAATSIIGKLLPKIIKRPKVITLVRFLERNPKSLTNVIFQLNDEVKKVIEEENN